jgi:FMN phosphatase YigB (HAD superfamily)
MNKLNPNKLVLFDIDHTLFNTELYRKQLYKNLADELKLNGKDHYEIVDTKYKEIKNKYGYFRPDEFLKSLLNISTSNTDYKTLASVFHNKDLYRGALFPEVEKVLLQLKKMSIQIGIFSTGNNSYQKIKIKEIKKYLNENHIHIVTDKFKIIKTTLDTYNEFQAYLVDDYPQILIDAKAHNNNLFTIFINRKERYPGTVIPNDFKSDATITHLSQLIGIIRNTK